MGFNDHVAVDEKVADSTARRGDVKASSADRGSWSLYLAVILIAAAVYLGCIVSPPSLQDDVDAVQAQIARTMLVSGDWVTARLDGVAYLEKAPMVYWLMAGSYQIFGVHDWAARIPIALSAIGLCWLTAAFGSWAFGKRAGFYAGLCMATCIGLFLFTRILIPDVMLTFTVALAMWAMLRALDDEERYPHAWAFILAASLGVGLLWKSLIGLLFPVAAGLIYLFVTRQLFVSRTWKRLHPFLGTALILLIAAPWHVLATLRNPPYFDFTWLSVPGEYHGFLWFYFMNEQVLRFLNLRTPRDYNTVPRLYFWLFHLLWLFPVERLFPSAVQVVLQADGPRRAHPLAGALLGRFHTCLFHLFHHAGVLLDAVLPGAGLLLGSAMATGGAWIKRGTRVLAVVSAWAALAVISHFAAGSQCARAGRYSKCAQPSSQRLHAVAGPHGRPDPAVVRLPTTSAGGGGGCILRRGVWRVLVARSACISGGCAHDGAFLPCCAAGAGGI